MVHRTSVLISNRGTYLILKIEEAALICILAFIVLITFIVLRILDNFG